MWQKRKEKSASWETRRQGQTRAEEGPVIKRGQSHEAHERGAFPVEVGLMASTYNVELRRLRARAQHKKHKPERNAAQKVASSEEGRKY